MVIPTDPPEVNWGPGDAWSEDPRTASLLAEVEQLRVLLGQLAAEYRLAVEHAGGVANASQVYQRAAEAGEEE